MAVYMIVDISVHDEQTYATYVAKAQEIVRAHGGRYLVRGGEIRSRSGGWDPQRIVLIEFPGMDQLRSCFRSSQYAEIAPMRERSTDARVVIVEGVPEGAPEGERAFDQAALDERTH